MGRAAVAVLVLGLVAGWAWGCGSTGSVSIPTPPTAVIQVRSWLVDVGGRYWLDASASTDPHNAELDYTWTVINPRSNAKFEDHCEDVPEEICTHNDDDPCSDDPNTFCTSNDDCASGTCLTNTGTTSSECSSGKCLVGKGRQGVIATFVADVPGPYSVRLLVESNRANDVATITLDTYPSLFVVGSLYAFGGTQGGLVGEFADASSFAAGATRGVADPETGNILLAVPAAGLVREFDYRDGSVVGTFGETAVFNNDPVALAFDAAGRLFVADSDGQVQVYDGGSGLFIRTFGDVAGPGEGVSALAFSTDGHLLVVDGGAGRPIREYASDGTFLGSVGDTGSAVGRAVDVAVADDGTGDLLIADADGQVVRCTSAGTGCSPLPAASALLKAGGPTAIAINPADAVPEAKVLVADAVLGAVVACDGDGTTCAIFGETGTVTSTFADVLFAPPEVPTTTTTTLSTTTTTVTVTTTTTAATTTT